MFREALVITQEIIQAEEGNDSLDVSNHSAHAEAMLTNIHLSETLPRKPLHVSVNEDSRIDTDFVYRTPLTVSESDMNEHDMDEFDLNCIILFNLAIANHMLALEEECTKSQRRLKKALKFYEMSFSLQVDLGSMSITSILALVNNCASIYQTLKRTNRAEKFYKHMLSTLMAMIEIGEASEVGQLEGFLHNATRLILQDVAAPAA
ncbi:MAG: hypothetical protein SGILL_000481 [Bacillariaceae sp.]